MKSLFAFLFALFLTVSVVYAAPGLINYQGALTDGVGLPKTGTVSVEFKIFDEVTAGTLKWSEVQPVVASNGAYNVLLGSVNPFPDNLFKGGDLWLELKVGVETLQPRQQLTSVPFALQAKEADLLDGLHASEIIDAASPVCPPVNQDGDLVECYSGPLTTAGVGACRKGVRVYSSGAFGACQGEVLPSPEACDGIDNDCNGLVDDNPTGLQTWYVDSDGDGFGLDGTAISACTELPGRVTQGGDCDDTNKGVRPNGFEFCDGLDNDCDTQIDENCVVVPESVSNNNCLDGIDNDGDGLTDCEDNIGSAAGDDCKTASVCAQVNSYGETCNGLDDNPTGLLSSISGISFVDEKACKCLTDAGCDDIAPGYLCTRLSADVQTCFPPCNLLSDQAQADALCDFIVNQSSCNMATGRCCVGIDCFEPPPVQPQSVVIDNDLDGYSLSAGDCNDYDPQEHPGVTWYRDADGDGYGDPASASSCSRSAPTDVTNGMDCDDTDPSILSGNGVWYADADRDGYGDPAVVYACGASSAFDVQDNTDCDDSDPSEHPGMTWYVDGDADGYGDPASASTCQRTTPGDILLTGDCDDVSDLVHPGAVEICGDGIDNNCDGQIDETCVDADGDGVNSLSDCNDADPNVWDACGSCVDGDGDTYFVGCDAYATVNGPDCSDTDPNVWNSCGACLDGDGDTSFVGCDAYATVSGPDCNDADVNNWNSCTACVDVDGDTYFVGCDAYVTINGMDCNDYSIQQHPGLTEICDGIDNNCLNGVDEGAAPEACLNQVGVCAGATTSVCLGASGWQTCSATEYTANNAAYQLDETSCDGLDNDCDGTVDEGCGGSSTSLLISEYVDSSIGNDALELYNISESSVDLSTCTLFVFADGSASPTTIQTLSGTVFPGETYVLCSTIFSGACQSIYGEVQWTGNDAIMISCGADVIQDSIGQIGFNPGIGYWGSGSNTTQNHTLRRECTVLEGDTIPDDPYNTTGWNSFNEGTIGDLGQHVCP